MTQFPSPYPPPQHQPPPPYGYGAQPGYPFHALGTDVLKPARRAAVLMIVLGALMAAFGACYGGAGLFVTPEQLAEQRAAMSEAGFPQPDFDVETIKKVAAVFGFVVLGTGIAFIVSGVFVRRGTAGAVTFALVLAGFIEVILGLLVLLGLISAFAVPSAAITACVVALPFLLGAWLVVWLAQAARASGAVAASKNQFNAQFYPHPQQQQQQAYAAYPAPPGYGYGYGYPAQAQPPQNPAPAPPPPPASEENPPPTS